jgi:hypothetical protein
MCDDHMYNHVQGRRSGVMGSARGVGSWRSWIQSAVIVFFGDGEDCRGNCIGTYIGTYFGTYMGAQIRSKVPIWVPKIELR